jgi:hypothetical protein
MSTDEQAHVLLELPRGETEVLRLTRKIYEGRPFTDLRVHFRGTDGGWYPTKKGTSIRDSELHSVLDALAKIAKRIEGGAAPQARVTRTSGAQRSLPAGSRNEQPASDSGYDSSEDGKLF